MAEKFSQQELTKDLHYLPLSEIRRVASAIRDPFIRVPILADIFRINVLYMIMRAGSGHIGTSFSSLDILTWLWTQELHDPNQGWRAGSRTGDLFFSSKGHDAPALYALLIGLGKLPFSHIHKLRRLNGLPGHPDVGTPFIAANTGSLGMGISKARGMALAQRMRGVKGKIYVLTGDGELQEGQIWESLQPTVNGKFSEITAIVDHNKLQSDTLIKRVSNIGDIEKKFRAFGWEVARCSGHDLKALARIIKRFKQIKNRPQVIIADTIKGKGVSFMQPGRLGSGKNYKFHAGAPSFSDYELALAELRKGVDDRLARLRVSPLRLVSIPPPLRSAPKHPAFLVDAYGDELLRLARKYKHIVALDADLLTDCGIVPFKREMPDRFVECGIAEQDMVSMAGGMALRGLLPVVHSFACFLSARPNEQFYTNATERTKIIYTGTLAGLLPGGPGHSHQSVRDISALGSMPGLTLIKPGTEQEARLAIRWAVEKNSGSTYIRLSNVPLDLPYHTLPNHRLEPGKGVFVRNGKHAVLVAYGPVMLREAVLASDYLRGKKISLAVADLPWLNRVDPLWLKKLLSYKTIITLDDHYVSQGQGQMLAAALARLASGRHPRILSWGVEEIPVSGWNQEVLEHHKLDARSLASRIQSKLI